MPEVDVMPGNKAVAYGVKLSRVKGVSLFPITPQTTIVEYLADFIADGELDAEYIHAEGEHTAMGAAIGLSLGGLRTFTATNSQGLAYMHECVAQAPAFRTPILMAIANRTLGWFWSIQPDYSDVMPELNLGWLIQFVESNQECLDTVIQLYKIAEDDRVLLPAMMCLDGFYLSYSNERVLIPNQEDVDEFLPSFEPRTFIDPTVHDYCPSVGLPPELHTTYRRIYEEILHDAKQIIEDVDKEFGEKFGRRYGGLIEKYKCEDVEAVLVTMGSMTTAARRAIDAQQRKGKRIGLVKLKTMRPFPTEEFRELGEEVRAIGVADRMVLHGTGGGGVFSDLKSALYGVEERPLLMNFIGGMGGDDLSSSDFIKMCDSVLKTVDNGKVSKEVEYIEHSPKPSGRIIPFEEKRVIYPGSGGCAGCGASIAIRHILDVLGPNTVVVDPPNCASVNYSEVTSVPWFLVNYAATAGYQTGLLRAYRSKGKADKIHVICFAGDGGTTDIGLQALSGAAERGEPFIWICYDNEAYMNTGIQRSGSTPLYARTTTTPIGKVWRGKSEKRKNVPLIMAAHKIPYIATASIAYIPDLRRKVEKAAGVTSAGRGLAYIHIQQPCPTGWYFPAEKVVEVGRAAVQTGAWPLLEIEDGVLKLNVKPRELKSISEYLKLQRRFRHLSDEQIEIIQKEVSKDWESWLNLERIGKLPWY
jgi:pyruvate ferredoxin oxidoreductase alpha subunit